MKETETIEVVSSVLYLLPGLDKRVFKYFEAMFTWDFSWNLQLSYPPVRTYFLSTAQIVPWFFLHLWKWILNELLNFKPFWEPLGKFTLKKNFSKKN